MLRTWPLSLKQFWYCQPLFPFPLQSRTCRAVGEVRIPRCEGTRPSEVRWLGLPTQETGLLPAATQEAVSLAGMTGVRRATGCQLVLSDLPPVLRSRIRLTNHNAQLSRRLPWHQHQHQHQHQYQHQHRSTLPNSAHHGPANSVGSSRFTLCGM